MTRRLVHVCGVVPSFAQLLALHAVLLGHSQVVLEGLDAGIHHPLPTRDRHIQKV
jgi:hypothetical protein